MSINLNSAVVPHHPGRSQANHVVLVVEDHQDAQSELKEVLAQNGYGVIGTDNGQDAAQHARRIRPDLLLIDLDVPLLYELVAARQILKQAQLWQLPVVIVTHEDVIDPCSIMEVGARRNEYVTRLSDYDQLQYLLDYLLPAVLPPVPASELTSSNNFRTDALERFAPDALQPTWYQCGREYVGPTTASAHAGDETQGADSDDFKELGEQKGLRPQLT